MNDGPPGLDPGFLALAKGGSSAVFVVRHDTVYWANDAASVLTGRAGAQLVDSPFWALVHPDQREQARQRARPADQGPSPRRLELRFLRAGDEERWVDVSVTGMPVGGAPALLVVVHDMTDLKVAERTLREAERRMQDILENLQLVAVMRDTSGEVTFANPYFLELVGAEEDEVIGRDWFETFVPLEKQEDERAQFLERVGPGSLPSQQDTEVLTRFDERRVVSWNHTVLHDMNGQVVGLASMGSDVTERKRVERQLVHDALHDPLTGLPNRSLFQHHLVSAFARARRKPDRLLAVMFVDVDRFKLVNDSLGHVVGDQLLEMLSRALRAAVRPGDIVARLGGDEFTILLEDLEDAADATRVAERIHGAVASAFAIGGHEVFASLSIGIAQSSRNYVRAEDLLRDADTAMYQAKGEGRARTRIFDTSMHSRAMHQLAMESDLRRAVERSSFLLHYQPIVELVDGRLVGFEALTRWDHSERGLVAPSEFVNVAEETGLIAQIGNWALQESCRDMQQWLQQFPRDLDISVNVSSRQFALPDLVDQVDFALRESGLSPSRLRLEVTESAIMDNVETALGMMGRLRDLGARVSIDDFGTGYSSLGYLLRFPADRIKIDRSFVAGMVKDSRNRQVVQAIVSLCNVLGMDVVAEGIETEEQRAALLSMGCHLGQGYLFARPMDGTRIQALLEQEARRP